jgi:RNA polymerase sigma-70 factor (ECF subfamily)
MSSTTQSLQTPSTVNAVIRFPANDAPASSATNRRSTKPKSPERAARSAASAAEAAYDAELVRRFNAGDEAAFVEIVNRHREKIFTITRSLLHNHADAEEITQDTFIRAHRGLARFLGESSLSTWLHRIAVNLARNRYWYFFRRRRYATLSLDCPLSDDSNATFTELVASDQPDPARTAVADEFSALIQDCMDKLPAPHREVLVLRNVMHRSYDEIAQSLGITVGTVKSRIARARENIRAKLVEMCPEFGPEADLGEWFEANRPTASVALAAA